MKIIIKTLVIAALAIVSCKENTQQGASIQEAKNPDKPLLATLENSTIAPTTKTLYVNAQSGLSLREGITLRSTKKLTLPYGAQVTQVSAPAHTGMTIEGIAGEMVEVDYQGARGFVFNGYLTTLAPPLKNETVSAYAQRISTFNFPVTVSKQQNEKGAAYGMTTSLVVPAKSWNEAYAVAKKLFDLPASLRLDLSSTKQESMQNTAKRRKTVTDQVVVNRNAQEEVEDVVYTYALKDYSRIVRVKKAAKGFEITEKEVSH